MTPTPAIAASTPVLTVSRFLHATRTINFLLTARGALTLIFVALLFIGPVSNDSDIIASIFAYTLVGIIVISLVFTVTQGVRLRKTLRVSLHSPGENAAEYVSSGAVTRFLLRTSKVELAPFFILTIHPEFEYSGVTPSLHRLTGSSGADRYLNELITFPHRGDWNIVRITATLGDQLGFTQLRWEMHPNPAQVFRVEPPRVQEPRLPIISSCQRSGDLIVATQDRLGDPFDLKTYHPADGLKKVVWKIFARTGELISRHPEHSMSPEGQVIVYCATRPLDDYVCSSALAYLEQLYALDLEIFFGCDGALGRSPARSTEDARDMLIETAWNEPQGTNDLRDLLDFCSRQLLDSHIDKVIVFAAKDSLVDPAFREHLTALADFLELRRITPVFYMIEKEPRNIANAVGDLGFPAKARQWFFEGAATPLAVDPALYSNFVTLCSQRKWEIFS